MDDAQELSTVTEAGAPLPEPRRLPESEDARGLGSVQFLYDTRLEAAYERYRCVHLQEQLGLQQVPASLASLRDAAPLPLTGGVVVFNRVAMRPRNAQIIETARAHGRALVYSTDDLLFADEFARHKAYYRGIQLRDHVIKARRGVRQVAHNWQMVLSPSYWGRVLRRWEHGTHERE